MTRPEPVRYLRTAHSMAFPEGRLLALREGLLYLLAPDGWTKLGHGRPASARWIDRAEAEDWCESEGWDLGLLDQVPALTR
jgi:hypothetical protein